MHLFAGAGGGLLADLILGHTPVAAVEWDAYCCQVLRERADWFPGLRVHEGDIRLFDPSEYAGRVDCIHAGFPCQPYSFAGRRAGIDDPRGGDMWNEVVRCLRIVRPPYVFLENVGGFVSLGLGTVLGDLAALGFDAKWTCLSAARAGAPHIRERWWLCGYADKDGESASAVNGEASGLRGVVADAERDRWQGVGNGRKSGTSAGDDSRRAVAGTDHAPDVGDAGRLHEGWGAEPGETEGGRALGEFAGPSWWQSEPDVGRVVAGIPARAHRLRALGNAQVPLQAALAWRILTGG